MWKRRGAVLRVDRVRGQQAADTGREDAAPGETEPAESSAPEVEADTGPREEAVRRARQQVWAAEAACCYAERRFQRSGNEAHRLFWLKRRRECAEAREALAAAEQALAQPATDEPADDM